MVGKSAESVTAVTEAWARSPTAALAEVTGALFDGRSAGFSVPRLPDRYRARRAAKEPAHGSVVLQVPNVLYRLHFAPAATSIVFLGPSPGVVAKANASRRK